jgi:hypothetical protein
MNLPTLDPRFHINGDSQQHIARHIPQSQPRSVAYTLKELRELGFSPIPTRPGDPKALVYRSGTREYQDYDWRPGMGTAIRLGQRRDGTYLCRLDLDGHHEDQDPLGALDTILQHIASFLPKIAIKRSTTGSGIDILFISYQELPNNQKIFLDGRHIGEIFCEGGHLPLVEHFLHGGLSNLVSLTPDELELLLSVIKLQHGTRNPTSWTARAREGAVVIRGYQMIKTAHLRTKDGMPRSFVGSERKHKIAQQHFARIKSAKTEDRSEALACYIQSLMLLAPSLYGTTIAERCRAVAALALEDCPEGGEQGYDAVRDIAALIARILHGDAYQGHPGHFLVPFWAMDFRPPVRPSHRPKGDQAAKIEALRRLFRQYGEGNRIEYFVIRQRRQKLTVGLLARLLRAGRRSIRRYLQQLEENKEIFRDWEKGRNGRLIITLLPVFGQVSDK